MNNQSKQAAFLSGGETLSQELEKLLQFPDPRCVALEVVSLAFNGQAPPVDCILAGLRRLMQGAVNKKSLSSFIDTVEAARLELRQSPESFRPPSKTRATVTLLSPSGSRKRS